MAEQHDDDLDDILRARRYHGEMDPVVPVAPERATTVARGLEVEGIAENFDAGLHLAGTYIDNPDSIIDNSISRPALAGTEYFHGGVAAGLPTPDDLDVDDLANRPEYLEHREGFTRADADDARFGSDVEAIDPDPPFDTGPAPDNPIDFHPIDVDRGLDLVDRGGPGLDGDPLDLAD